MEREAVFCRNCGELIDIEDFEEGVCPHCGRDPLIILEEEE